MTTISSAFSLGKHLIAKSALTWGFTRRPPSNVCVYRNKGHSVETALLKVQSDIMLATDVELVVVQVLLDMSAAFDTIDHSILLHRLKYRFGVSGPALEWFASYLSQRYQYICIGKVTSSKRQISSGVPLGVGSVLGPLLFTMYISPLGDGIRKHGINFHLYADDFSCTCRFVRVTKGKRSMSSSILWTRSIPGYVKIDYC